MIRQPPNSTLFPSATLSGPPEDLRATTASVLALTGRRLEPAEAAAAVLARLTVWYDALRADPPSVLRAWRARADRKSTRLNSSHLVISYAVFCLQKKK